MQNSEDNLSNDAFFDLADTLMSTLNPGQIVAVKAAVAAKDSFFLQGSPEVDKTTLMAELCYQHAKHGLKTLIISQSNQTVDNVLSCVAKHPKIRALYKSSADRIDDKVLSLNEDKVVDTWLNQITSLCQQDVLDMRQEQEQAERMRLELARLAKRQAEIQKEYAETADGITRYNEQRQELTKIEDELQRECGALVLLSDQAALAKQSEKLQDAVAAQVSELQRLNEEKQNLVKCLSLLTERKPDSYVLLNSNRENQIIAVEQYRQYLIEFAAVAQKAYRQKNTSEDSFFNQDISLLLDRINTIKQRQYDLVSIEEDTINELQQISQVLIDTAREYGWSTSLLRSETQDVVVNCQSISRLRDRANELLWASPPIILARLGFCTEWKKTLFDLIIKAKAMVQLVNSPGTLLEQTTTEIENILLECHYLTQRIYEACYKHLLTCGHWLDRSYNHVQAGLVDLTRQLQSTNKVCKRLAELKNLIEQSHDKMEALAGEETTIFHKIAAVTMKLDNRESCFDEVMVRVSLATEWISRINKVTAAEKSCLIPIYIEQVNVIGMTFLESASQSFAQYHPECDVIISDVVSGASPPDIFLHVLKGRKVIMIG
ncbi:AAA domain-containing protein [Sporomusa malonica]|nr:AAA domain-containing protein [Sporomusa malonica]